VEATEFMIEKIKKFKTNDEFLESMKSAPAAAANGSK
jgi:transcription termination factor Rho